MILEILQKQAARLDKVAPVPLYYQIKQQLKEAIESGQLQPNEALPSERELIEIYGVSRPTVRQATEELLNEGFLYRKRGLGTFIAPPKSVQQVLPNLLGFSERLRQLGQRPGSRVLEQVVLEAPPESVLAHLGLPPESRVFQLRRLRSADGELVMLETTCLPIARFPRLVEADFGKVSLYDFLRREYGVNIARLRETLEPVLLGDYESQLLEVEKGTPAMRVQSEAFGADTQPIEYSVGLVRGDRCRYVVELDTRPEKRPASNDIEFSYSIVKAVR
jgi:GntR family transcriptional regulator